MCIMIIKRVILEAFRGRMTNDLTIAKVVLADIEKKVCQK